MATRKKSTKKPVKKTTPAGAEELSGGNIVRFENPGDNVSGYLMAIDYAKAGEAKSNLLTFEMDDGELVQCWSSSVIDNVLERAEVPVDGSTYLMIVFRGWETNKKRTQKYRNFQVLRYNERQRKAVK